MARRFPTTLLSAATLLLATAVSAAPQGAQPAPVMTQAVLVSTSDTGGQLRAQLKLELGADLAFTTLSYRVPDRALLAGVKPGDTVLFQAARVDGDNTLTALRPAPGCNRLHRCN